MLPEPFRVILFRHFCLDLPFSVVLNSLNTYLIAQVVVIDLIFLFAKGLLQSSESLRALFSTKEPLEISQKGIVFQMLSLAFYRNETIIYQLSNE